MVVDQSSALGMTLYSTFRYYALNTEFVHGCIAILIVYMLYHILCFLKLYNLVLLSFKPQHQFGVLSGLLYALCMSIIMVGVTWG